MALYSTYSITVLYTVYEKKTHKTDEKEGSLSSSSATENMLDVEEENVVCGKKGSFFFSSEMENMLDIEGDDGDCEKEGSFSFSSGMENMLDVEEYDVDCPICLNPMSAADHKHPMQCSSRNCCYNFCMTCVESLIISSKDDYMEASDGNRHVKVFLNCPNCRSSLGESIRDTLLLRKVDFISLNPDLSDEDLTASQLRTKNVMDNPEIQDAIVTARKFEARFFRKQLWDKEEESDENDFESLIECGYEEWGVEADLQNGAHESFRVPMSMKHTNEPVIDKSLLNGLEASLSKWEQEYVTKLMISGDTAKLAEAAKIMEGIGIVNRGGAHLSQHMRKQGSIYDLIADCEKARGGTTKKRRPSCSVTVSVIRKELEYTKLHPLPVRMPKYVTLSLMVDNHVPGAFACGENWKGIFPLTFRDDKWDGTVKDAFCKITINPLTRKIRKKRPPDDHQGVLNVLGKGRVVKDFGDARIDVECDRVVVDWVNSEAGRLGVMKGDVVTHLNGEEFKGNAADLLAAIQKNTDPFDAFTLVLNAEQSVAEALRRRAFCFNCDSSLHI